MELLADPLKDRVVKNLKAPPHKPLDKALIWPEKMKGLLPFDPLFCYFEKKLPKSHFCPKLIFFRRKTRLEAASQPSTEGGQDHQA